jgi:hypothetical protein
VARLMLLWLLELLVTVTHSETGEGVESLEPGLPVAEVSARGGEAAEPPDLLTK